MSARAAAQQQADKAAAAQGKKAAAAAAAGVTMLPPPDLPLGGGGHSHEDDDSHVDQTGADGTPANLLLQSALLSGEEGEDDSGEFAAVAAALNRLIKAKRGKQQQKQQAVLQELQDQVMSQLHDFEVAAAKDAKELEKAVTGTFNGLSKKLTDKFKAIEAINQRYQQDLKAAWEAYNGVFMQVEGAKDQTTALLVKRAATTKRKLASLHESLGERTAEAEGRLKKLTSSAAKQRNISDVLKCLMPSADAE